MAEMKRNVLAVQTDMSYVKRNVLTVYAEIMNPWADTALSIGSTQRKRLRQETINIYQPDHKPGRLTCMASGEELPENSVNLSHIWPARAVDGRLGEFGLRIQDGYTFRNAILMVATLEKAFDDLRIGFWYNHLTDELICRVIDPALLREKNKISGLNMTYAQLDGRVLQRGPHRETPFRRLLAWHYAACLDHARKFSWPTADLLPQIPQDPIKSWLAAGGSPEARWPKGDQHVAYASEEGLLVWGRAGLETARRASEVEAGDLDEIDDEVDKG